MQVVKNSQRDNLTLSGTGMDRRIERKPAWKRYWPWATGLFAIAILLVIVTTWTGGRTLVVEQERLQVATAGLGLFEDFIPIRGLVTPRQTVYLDAIEGGRVEEKLVEDGAMVSQGDLLVILSNTSLQLNVTQNEAMVTEQLNNMRTIELQLEQNRLQHKRNLVEINYQVKRLERQLDRMTNLDNAGVAVRSQIEDTRDELEYFINRRDVTLESQSTDARLQETQLAFLQKTGAQLEQNLTFARKNLDALNVRAPVSGKLSGFNPEVGQSIQRGGRLGQIDDPESFKLRASIDEYYLNRVDIGQTASMESEGDTYQLTVAKIYPQVTNGEFEVDLLFIDAEPVGIRRGQTIQARLTLGDAAEALLVPNGTFYQDTGGKWIFVISDDGSTAYRRTIRTGRRNARFIEVLDGLEPGEEVITSSYASFTDMDQLRLRED